MGVTITNSKLKTARRCTKQYQYKFVRNLAPNYPTLPMKRGSWLHRLLQAKYTEKGGWRRALKRELLPEYNKMMDEEKEMYGDLPTVCQNIMIAYDYHWKEEDSQIEVLAAELEFEVPLLGGHKVKGRIDLVFRDEFGLWIVEHKSHRSIPKADYRFLDVQTKLYEWGLNQAELFDEPVQGILWNYVRTKQPTKPKMTKMGRLSRARIDTDAFTYTGALLEYGLDPHDFRDTIMRLKKYQTFFIRHRVPVEKKVTRTTIKEAIATADLIQGVEKGVILPTRSIERGCEFGCSYRSLCITELYGGDTKQVRRDGFHTRKPGEYYGDEFVEAG